MKKPSNINNFVKAKIRFASLKWPPRSQSLKDAKKGVNQYECAMCHLLFKSKEVQIDHVDPVVPIDNDWPYGHIDWNVYIPRLFCEVGGYQILCKTCHSAKSAMEDAMRASLRENKRNQKKVLDKSNKKE